ncbi:PDZ domain-containing protein [Paenibacillus sp. HWE-109]|uniref:PDZ domain-containing protein n=1 Tax=Paenibacillus sp. HWE-109 TaxID=1306526 RepID=UPI001EE08A53|nr:PDZ domain-containing protein [Paenibacillus sp. HWE-109]UKS29170.1 PDZ domain-containing protein [Paenibacillus sp. HWE-109]
MRFWQRLYYGGMVLTLLLAILGELIWLPDPLRIGIGLYWIDLIDTLIYVLALVPCLWLIGALLHLTAVEGRWSQVRCLAIGLTSLVSVVTLITIPKKIEYSATIFVITLVLVFVDLVCNERVRRRLPIRNLLVGGASLCLLFVLFYPTKYLVTYPGLTLNMNRYAQAASGQSHGDITGVLIFERPAFPIDWLYAKLFPKYSFEVEDLGMSLGEYNLEVRTMKADANAAGSAIAYEKVGKGQGITSHGVRVTAIVKDSSVTGILLLGDVIVQVNGHAVAMISELTDVMKQTKPGDQASVQVLRNGQTTQLSLETRANPDDPSRAAFGIQVANEIQYDIPEIVTYHNYLLHEGGPSHGAMLALTLIDQLTPCGVTYGHHVAGTGTIEPDGSVGAVGGLEQKAYTISRTDADVFFVPASNEEEARKGAPSLRIVPVKTLDDMLNWLKNNPVPPNRAACS